MQKKSVTVVSLCCLVPKSLPDIDGNEGFDDVTFTNRYPMATVDFVNTVCPVNVQLQAYTPFVPLNRDDSSLPVIVMRYTVTNTSSAPQAVNVGGWLENFSNNKSRKKLAGVRVNKYRQLAGLSAVECSATSMELNGDQAEVKLPFIRFLMGGGKDNKTLQLP